MKSIPPPATDQVSGGQIPGIEMFPPPAQPAPIDMPVSSDPPIDPYEYPVQEVK